PLYLPSFPPRRSSDLRLRQHIESLAGEPYAVAALAVRDRQGRHARAQAMRVGDEERVGFGSVDVVRGGKALVPAVGDPLVNGLAILAVAHGRALPESPSPQQVRHRVSITAAPGPSASE